MLSRALLGAVAGIAGTVAMTAAMRVLFNALPPDRRYPLPPRELVEAMHSARAVTMEEDRSRARASMLAHLAYGAATGTLFALASSSPGPTKGAGYGVAVWAGSYLGWIPALGLLKPATRHPAERNALMLAAHLVWGATLGATLHEIERTERQAFKGSDNRDAKNGAGPAEPRATA